MSDEEKRKSSSPPGCLYHYCSNTSLISILQSKSLRLSLLSLSNDYLEGKWIKTLFAEACKSRQFADWKIDTLCDSFDLLLSLTPATGFCMSAEGDLLSQWRGYADQGHGVSVGFSGDYLAKLCDAPRDNRQFGVTLRRVEYDVAVQQANLAPTIDMIAERAGNVERFPGMSRFLLAGADHELASQEHRSSIVSMTLPVLLLMGHLYTSKNPAFREEYEWRLLSFVIGDKEAGEIPRYCDFRASSDRIIPYVTLELADVGTRAIDHVLLGPKNQTPLEVVRALLAKHGMEGVNVDRSKASYR